MRAVILTCRNHPELRWSCKEVAFSEGYGYNGSRNIFFNGVPSGRGMYSDLSGLDCTNYVEGKGYVAECPCPPTDLVRAPEDALVKRV